MIRKLNFLLFKSLYWSTAILSFMFFLMVCLNVFTRYVLKTPILASIELSRLFFVWSCFLAAGLTYYKKGHIAISFISDRLPAFWQKLANIIIHCFTLVFLTALTWWSLEVINTIWFTRFPILGISQGWLYIPVFLVSVFMIFFNVEFLFSENPSKPSIQHAGDTDN